MKRIDVGRSGDGWGFSQGVDPSFAPMVERLAEEARHAPRAYARRVLMAAALGYAALLGWMLLMGLVIAGTIFLFVSGSRSFGLGLLLLLAGANLWLTIRALFVRHAPPDGLVLAQADAPALFAMVEEVRRAVDGPVIHELRLSEDFNAGIVQLPRLGPLGWYRNYLFVGLPLLQALPADEMKAVIAHEFGHLVNADGKLSTWVYRVRQTWVQLADALSYSSWARLLQRFFRWYGPWFNAMSFGLARQTEYAADAVSARVTDAPTAAATLVRVDLSGRRYDRDYWAGVHAAAVAPDADRLTPFAGAAPFLAEPHAGGGAEQALARALTARTDLGDTHPVLADRLQALGVAPAVPAPLVRSAAESLLPDGGAPLADALDARWWQQTESHWQAVRADREEAAQRLAALEAAAIAGTLDPAGWTERADLTETLHGPGAAAAIHDVIARAGTDITAAAAAARCRLQGGDAAALDEILQQARRADLEPGWRRILAGIALDWIDDHAPGHPLTDALRTVHSEMAALEAALDAELVSLDETNEIVPLPGHDALRRALADAGAADPAIRRIWVAGSPWRADPGNLRIIVLFEDSTLLKTAEVGGRVDMLLAVMTVHGAGMVVRSQREHRWLRKRIEALPDAQVFAR